MSAPPPPYPGTGKGPEPMYPQAQPAQGYPPQPYGGQPGYGQPPYGQQPYGQPVILRYGAVRLSGHLVFSLSQYPCLLDTDIHIASSYQKEELY